MRFKEFLKEFRSNMPQGNPYNKEDLISWISESKLLHLQLVIPGKKDITVYEYSSLGPEDTFIILTDRVDKEDIVGYMYLHKMNDKIWQVRDVIIFDPYKKKGLGFDLYVKLIKEGYNLINGYSLSTEVESLWRKLHTQVNVQTYDLKNDKISEFDERPAHDNNSDDTLQTFFWLATSKDATIKESLENKHPSHYDRYMLWLEGKTSIPYGFRTAKYGEEGDL